MGILASLFGCGDKTSTAQTTNTTLSELDTISFENLSKKSYEYLTKQQEICQTEYKMGSYQDWYYDQTTGKLTFSDNGVVKLSIDYEDIGSYSLETHTWLWSWDNSSVEENVKQQIETVRKYGEKRNFKKLKEAKWTADEYDAWEMTAIASYLLKSKGVYRAPLNDEKLLSFMLFKTIAQTDTTK